MLKFYANSNILVIGSSGSGKTTAVMRIIREQLIEPMPKKILYMYGTWQPMFEEWRNDKSLPSIEFIEGLKMEKIDEYDGPKLLICDDLILSLSRDMTNHFIRGSSHKQTTTIFISHSLYLNNEFYRLISNNSQYIILFKNKRNLSQISTLARQVLGGDSQRLLEAYAYLSAYSFVLLSFHPKVPEKLLVIADFFEKCPSAFI